MALQHPQNSPLHAELRQAKHQPAVTGDLDEQEQTSKRPTLLEKPSLLRPQGMESRQHPLQDTHSTQELAWDCSSSSQHSLLPLISAGKQLRASSVPFFPKAWIPQAPLSILPWPGCSPPAAFAYPNFQKRKSNPNCFFLLLFSRLHIEIFRIMECKEYFVLPIPCDFRTDKWKRISEEKCC